MNQKMVILGYTLSDEPEGGYPRIILCLISLKEAILGYTVPDKPEGGYPKIYSV